MVLPLPVRSISTRMERGIAVNEPVDVCFKEHRLPSRFGDHRDALVVLMEGIPGGVDAFLTKCGRRWLLGRDTPVDERQHGKADDSIGTFCDFVVIQAQRVPFARFVMVLQLVRCRCCLEGEWNNCKNPGQAAGMNSRGYLAHVAWPFSTRLPEPEHESSGRVAVA